MNEKMNSIDLPRCARCGVKMTTQDTICKRCKCIIESEANKDKD